MQTGRGCLVSRDELELRIVDGDAVHDAEDIHAVDVAVVIEVGGEGLRELVGQDEVAPVAGDHVHDHEDIHTVDHAVAVGVAEVHQVVLLYRCAGLVKNGQLRAGGFRAGVVVLDRVRPAAGRFDVVAHIRIVQRVDAADEVDVVLALVGVERAVLAEGPAADLGREDGDLAVLRGEDDVVSVVIERIILAVRHGDRQIAGHGVLADREGQQEEVAAVGAVRGEIVPKHIERVLRQAAAGLGRTAGEQVGVIGGGEREQIPVIADGNEAAHDAGVILDAHGDLHSLTGERGSGPGGNRGRIRGRCNRDAGDQQRQRDKNGQGLFQSKRLLDEMNDSGQSSYGIF